MRVTRTFCDICGEEIFGKLTDVHNFIHTHTIIKKEHEKVIYTYSNNPIIAHTSCVTDEWIEQANNISNSLFYDFGKTQ